MTESEERKMIHLGDITKINGAEIEPVDCITAGSPCQDLSVAGKRAGLEGERSGLFMEQIRIIKEMREHDRNNGRTDEHIRPRYMVWENVPGAFSSNKGEDFRAVLEETAKVAEGDACIPRLEKWPHAGCIMGDGWSLAWRLHDAQFWGVPQRRKRIALVADFGGLSASEVLFERKGLSGDFAESGTQGERTAGAAGEGVEGAGGEVAATITATYGTKWNGNAGAYNGQNFVIEGADNVSGCLKTQPHGVCDTVNSGTTEGMNIVPSVLAYGIDQQGGKGGANYTEDVCPPILSDSHGTPHAVAYGIGCDVYNQEITGDVAASLTAASGGSNTSRPKVIERKESAVYDARGNGDGKTVCTITRDHQNRVTDYTALCVGNGQANQSVSDKAGALNTMHDQQAVMVAAVDCRNGRENPDINGTLQAKENGGQSLNYQNTVRCGAIVRRLTPLECERLQGYPDGWTDIGEWVDSKGKKHGEADSPRYKALGNSIALPFWQWMARRICAQYERPMTMASLFDGIGGFPLVFQRCGALPVWASEIEEFPIAVTKVRFPDESV